MYNPYENHPYDPQQTSTEQTREPQEETGERETPLRETQETAAPSYTQGYPYYNPYQPRQTPPQPPVQPQAPAQPQPQAQRTAYTWNAQTAQPVRQTSPYYGPIQPPKPQKKRKKGFGLKLLAAVLACAVVSFGSMGVFALMIQNGVVRIQTPESSTKTAAFTIYRKAEDSVTSTPTVTGKELTAQEVAKKLIPSVVCIQNYQIVRQNGFYFGGYSYGGNSGTEVSPAGEGSGIILSKDGYIVTNQHVIDGATSLKVVTSEGLTYEAELVGEDTQTDLAVIKITTEDELTPAEFGSSEDMQVADAVMAIGNPGGMQLNSSVTIGYVSALNREITNSDTGYSMKCIQTDAAINPGNSGGALVDMDGHVVGINSSKIAATAYEGLGFAIPAETAQPIVSDLIEYGYVKDRPMIGIYGQYVDRMTASFYGLSSGYYVSQVNSKHASESGLQRGDVITAIDDVQVTSSTTLSNYIAGKKPGETVTLTVDRGVTGERGLQMELILSENTGEAN